MKLKKFKSSLEADTPPSGISPALQALWHQAKGDWNTAHNLAQSDNSPAACWVYAHLHRVEGDKSNAAYWYRLAGKSVSSLRISEEWEEISASLLINNANTDST